MFSIDIPVQGDHEVAPVMAARSDDFEPRQEIDCQFYVGTWVPQLAMQIARGSLSWSFTSGVLFRSVGIM